MGEVEICLVRVANYDGTHLIGHLSMLSEMNMLGSTMLADKKSLFTKLFWSFFFLFQKLPYHIEKRRVPLRKLK